MKAFDNGCFYSCQATSADTEAFAKQWPCSGLRYGDTVWFQFDKRNGDLVDLQYRNGGRPANPDRVDGSAMLALSQDCQAYAKKRLRIN